MIKAKQLIEWASKLPPESGVMIDESGVALLGVSSTAYLAVGGYADVATEAEPEEQSPTLYNQRIEDALVDYLLNVYDEVGDADVEHLNQTCVEVGGPERLGTKVIDAWQSLEPEKMCKLSRVERFDASLREWLRGACREIAERSKTGMKL